MTYSRHDFLRIAVAGLPVVTGVPWLLTGAAHARSSMEGEYDQAQADRIHNRSSRRTSRRPARETILQGVLLTASLEEGRQRDALN